MRTRLPAGRQPRHAQDRLEADLLPLFHFGERSGLFGLSEVDLLASSVESALPCRDSGRQ